VFGLRSKGTSGKPSYLKMSIHAGCQWCAECVVGAGGARRYVHKGEELRLVSLPSSL
jgi:hypothetical protein